MGELLFPSTLARFNYFELDSSYQTPQIPITKLRLTFQGVISKNTDKIR